VYQPNNATATGGSNRKVPCLGYTPRMGEVPNAKMWLSIIMKQDHFTMSLASK